MSMLPEYPSDPISYLLRRKFGNAALSGPVSGLLEDEEKTQTQLYAEIQTYRTELQGFEEEQLFALAYQEREKEAHELKDLEEQTPFYDRTNAQADFEYWGRVPLWRLDEAIALSFGKNPFLVTWRGLEDDTETSAFAARFANLRHLVLRAKEAKHLTDPVSPDAYIAWAKANHVTLPPELEESVQAFSGEVPDWKALYEETKSQLASATKASDRPVSEKERKTFLRIVLGMAIGGYGYDHRAERGPTAKEIADDLLRLGMSVDVDTVRAKLKEAVAEFGDVLPKPDDD